MGKKRQAKLTWKDVVLEAVKEIGRPARPKEINERIAGHPKCRTNPTWNATVRRTLQQYSAFESLKDGRWRLRELPELRRIQAKELTHSHAQGFLLELGRLYGYETFTPDRSRNFGGVRLGEVATLRKMPLFSYPRVVKTVGRIDVIWFGGGADELIPQYAFEVEHTTGVASGLSRLFQLYRVRGKETKLFVVLPDKAQGKFKREVEKEPYRLIRDHLTQRTYKQLTAVHQAAVRHAPLKKSFLVG